MNSCLPVAPGWCQKHGNTLQNALERQGCGRRGEGEIASSEQFQAWQLSDSEITLSLAFVASQESKGLSSRWARPTGSEMPAVIKRKALCFALESHSWQRGAEVRVALWNWNYFCSDMWHDLLVVTTDLTMTSDLGLPLISELVWAKT